MLCGKGATPSHVKDDGIAAKKIRGLEDTQMTVDHRRKTVVRPSGTPKLRPTPWGQSFFNAPVVWKSCMIRGSSLFSSPSHGKALAFNRFTKPCKGLTSLHTHARASMVYVLMR